MGEREREKMGVTNAKTLEKDKIVLRKTCGNKHYQALLVLISLFVHLYLLLFILIYMSIHICLLVFITGT